MMKQTNKHTTKTTTTGPSRDFTRSENVESLNHDSRGRSQVIQDVLVFLNFCKIFSEREILWSLCSVVFLVLTLKLSFQTSLSVAPKLPIFSRSGGNCQNVVVIVKSPVTLRDSRERK